ncbi:LysM peptidoglycan-binding domain-containing protein [Lysinibacillus halotolerans]|uniref:LysM peptidoglycan-binding domain-containing protein n=1 Tax=Lysinibacillus halotolerans TaxID=1368476 RepID=A0A3M8H871_9BACI|nr:glycoside hydrolase family 18 protein [Lysinibacillus halotolerans]RNC98625.1 LysM peptidoglycan-binding domain-containing protein [Lysinibacillus halotolerans]
MQIHVVQPGQSLWGIAQAYNSTTQNIIEANQIEDPERLVVGQALVIPIYGSFYWVQQGDTLYAISQRFGLSVETLAQVNGINVNTPLYVGMRLYVPPMQKRDAEVNIYIEPTGESISEELLTEARNVVPYLTYLAPFSFEARRDGSLDPIPTEGLPDIAEAGNASLMMVVSNLENGQFSGELGRAILQSTAVQEVLLENIVDEARRIGRVTDIHFDFEFLPADQREAYNNFLRRAADYLHGEGFLISTALAPKTSAEQAGQWYEAHDYRAHGEIVDFVVLMTYEWGYSGGPPMAVSPINEVERVINYALTEMPANKIMMGQNLYGYDWTLPFVEGGEYARAVSPQRAVELARDYNVTIQFDYTAQAPHFNYVDEEGNAHKVWFEDARSIQAKFNLMKRLNLRGISYWKLDFAFPQNWLLIEENFNVVKRQTE